jgi:hypothetical protein
MRDAENLLEDFLEDRITLKELSADELDAVVEELTDIGEGLLGTDKHEVGIAILNALDVAIDMHSNTEEFEQAILAAEARGSVYWEFENHNIH